MDEVVALDQQLLLALNGSDSVVLDTFFMTVTRTATWIPMFVALLYIVWQHTKAIPSHATPQHATPSSESPTSAAPTSEARLSPSRGSGERVSGERVFTFLLFIVATAIVILIADRVSSGLCKPFFHRFRPSHEPALAGLVDLVGDYRGGLYGFISSHAANTFGVATFVAFALRHRATTLTLFAWACLSSYSRIYLGVHYPGDILAGAIWGALSALFVYYLTSLLTSRFQCLHYNFPSHFPPPSLHFPFFNLLLPLTFLLTIFVAAIFPLLI